MTRSFETRAPVPLEPRESFICADNRNYGGKFRRFRHAGTGLNERTSFCATRENWQSEFLQLLWQVGGSALLLYFGSPQSKEGSERVEAEVDEILRQLDPEEGEQLIAKLDRKFLKN